jgi:Flp pilus assembly pilin Flp
MASNEIQAGPVLVLTSGTPGEQGVTAVEYALIVAIIAVLLLGAFYALFNTVLDRYSSVATCVDSGPLPGACAPDPAAPPDRG